MRLHAIVEDATTARLALDGGATVIQLRLKDRPTDEVVAVGMEIRDECRRRGMPVVINDDVEAARELGAEFVHVGQEDLRRLGRPPDIPFGLSARNVDEALEAEKLGAGYIGAGPVWTTPSKTDTGAAIGLEGVAAIRAAVSSTVVAIGGIDATNAGECIRAGADGVAVIRAVREIRSLREAVDEALATR